MKIDYAGICDIGCSRKVNQDAIAMFSIEEIGVFVVADGMGGHTNGEIASQCIVHEITQWWEHFSEKQYEFDFQKMLQSIIQVLENANKIIYQDYNKNEICGSTAVILFIYKEKYGVVYAGDSRCYIYSKRKLKQLTVDEVWENSVGLSVNERNNLKHPNRGKLVNAIGIKENLQCKVLTDRMISQSVFLLCSDGFYKLCSEKYIKACLKKSKDSKRINIIEHEMLGKVYKNGSTDNISMIIVSLI